VNGDCIDCTPQDHQTCIGNEVHWVDSCGRQGELIETCAGGCSGDECLAPCELSACSSAGFTYTCGAGSSVSSSHYNYDELGNLTSATFNVSYSNGRSVSCTYLGSSLSTGSCQDNTDATCTF
jgi:hypothetical protein